MAAEPGFHHYGSNWFSRGPNVRVLERHFGCPVATGCAHNVIIFRAVDAKCPFVTRNAELLDMLAPQFDQELKQANDQHSFSDLVRDAIQLRLTGHRPSIDDIARDLHLSSRTLQRRLQELGLNYQRVLDEARHQMARYYLGNSVLELNEAAYLLGYEDANSFVRAFAVGKEFRLGNGAKLTDLAPSTEPA